MLRMGSRLPQRAKVRKDRKETQTNTECPCSGPGPGAGLVSMGRKTQVNGVIIACTNMERDFNCFGSEHLQYEK